MFVGISHCLFNHTHKFIHLSIIEGINLSYIRIGLKLWPHPHLFYLQYKVCLCAGKKKGNCEQTTQKGLKETMSTVSPHIHDSTYIHRDHHICLWFPSDSDDRLKWFLRNISQGLKLHQESYFPKEHLHNSLWNRTHTKIMIKDKQHACSVNAVENISVSLRGLKKKGNQFTQACRFNLSRLGVFIK